MDTTQITTALTKLYDEEQQRIIFWHDPDQEFGNILDSLDLQSVNLIRLKETSPLELKIRLECEDPTGKYLLYSPAEEPEFEDDWLLDIRLYSRSFRADRASIILDQLGLANQHLREHLAKRRKFFDNKDRVKKLQPLIEPNDNEADLDLKMLSVIVRSEQPELLEILRTIFHAIVEGDRDQDLLNPSEPGEVDLDAIPKIWDNVVKFELDDSFWRTVKTTFGYAEDNPSLKNLLIRLFVTDFAHHLGDEVPASLGNLLLPETGRANAVVLLGQWRDSASKAVSYDKLSKEVATRLKLEDQLSRYEIEQLIDVMTFQVVERSIITGLRDRVVETAKAINADAIRKVATRRQAGHWATSHAAGAADVPRKALHSVYTALVAAAEFFDLRNQYADGFTFEDAGAMYAAYEKELFRFDQLYRHFCEHADEAEQKGWDVLKPLRDGMEAVYGNWFLTNLGLVWGKFVDSGSEKSLLNSWRLDRGENQPVPNQYDFFARKVTPWLKQAESRRAYVIISDAFRYEAAEELTRELNGTYRLEADLSTQLGVLPSYTALGMASLLPHKTLSYRQDGSIQLDGNPTSSFSQRDQILAAKEGMAVKADELLAMKKDEGREHVAGKRVVYIYHNVVDAVGDSASTEDRTFEAVRKAINEVGELVRYVVNCLNGNYVVVTADHGFIFAESPPGEPDKSKLADKPAGTVIAKKRYLLGHDLKDHESAWHGSTVVTAKAEGDMEFWVPKAANRFHFAGGAKFFHGGAMLQEIVVPVITVKHLKDKKSREKTKTMPVTVHILGTSHKITTPRHRFELIQMESVSDRVKPITLKVAVYEGDEPVTNIETATFDSSSGNIDERKKWVALTLEDRTYDKRTPYRLILRDAETGIEQESVEVVIDRAFSNDF